MRDCVKVLSIVRYEFISFGIFKKMLMMVDGQLQINNNNRFLTQFFFNLNAAKQE